MVDLSLVKPEDLWYTVGLIATDGNLSTDGRHINITSKDKELLEGVKRILFINNKIIGKTRALEKIKKYSFLQFGDVKFYSYLLKIGLTPKKSLTLKPIKVPAQYFADFLRGVIDGDGSINTWKHRSNGNTQWALRVFSGSQDFISWLKKYIEKRFSVTGKLYGYQRNGGNFMYSLKFGKFSAKVILKQCYYTNAFSLKRKQLLAQKCLDAENKLSKYGSHNYKA